MARLPVTVVVGAATLLLFVIPALGRYFGLGAAVGGLFAAAPFAVLLYIQVVLANRGSVVVPRARGVAAPLVLWVVLLLVSMARSNNDIHSGINRLLLVLLWTWTIVATTLIAAECARYSSRTREAVLTSIALALPLYVAVNVVLYAIGVDNPQPLLVDHPEGSLGSLFGLRVARTLLPLARGINNFGVLAGMGLSASLAVLLSARSRAPVRFAAAALAVLSVVSLVLVDSRGPLLFGVIAGIGVPLLLRTPWSRAIRLAVPIAPVLPILLLFVLTAVARTPIAQWASRKPGDLSSATGRVLVWTVSANTLLGNPSPRHLVGYGQYGAKGAGASRSWAQNFVGFEADPTLASTHNFSLQLIFDLGYLGFAGVLWILWWCLGRLCRAHDDAPSAATAAFATMLLYLVLAGTTEATLSIIFSEPLILFTFIVAHCVFLGPVGSPVGASVPESRGPEVSKDR